MRIGILAVQGAFIEHEKQLVSIADHFDEQIECIEIRQKTDLENDEFIILAGNDYMKYLLEHIPNNYNPVRGLGIGQQMKFFKEFKCD